MNDELKGVAGWLLVFVIIMAVIAPAWSAITVYRELHTGQAVYLAGTPLMDQLRNFAWILVATDAVIGWIAVWRLVTIHNWLSVQIAIACVWIGSVGLAIAEYAGLTSITGLSFGDVIAETGPRGIIQPFGFALIWTAYLLKSQRVENTYRGGEEQAEVFE